MAHQPQPGVQPDPGLAGQQGLQTQEADAVANYKQAYQDFSAIQARVLSGDATVGSQAAADLDQIQAAFTALVQVNRKFADLSNQSAQLAFVTMRQIMIIAGILLSLCALAAGWWLSRMITQPLNVVVAGAKSIASGAMNREMSDTVRNRVLQTKDEIGDVGRGLTEIKQYMFEMIDVANHIAEGDLTDIFQSKIR